MPLGHPDGTTQEITMKNHSVSPATRALLAFVGTVLLALLAAVSLLAPDITAQSADSLSRLPSGLDQMLVTGFSNP